jgi:hypothetical protein
MEGLPTIQPLSSARTESGILSSWPQDGIRGRQFMCPDDAARSLQSYIGKTDGSQRDYLFVDECVCPYIGAVRAAKESRQERNGRDLEPESTNEKESDNE